MILNIQVSHTTSGLPSHKKCLGITVVNFNEVLEFSSGLKFNLLSIVIYL
jgi:hypothetical protein